MKVTGYEYTYLSELYW